MALGIEPQGCDRIGYETLRVILHEERVRHDWIPPLLALATAESARLPCAKGYNADSIDWGLWQVNDYYWGAYLDAREEYRGWRTEVRANLRAALFVREQCGRWTGTWATWMGSAEETCRHWHDRGRLPCR